MRFVAAGVCACLVWSGLPALLAGCAPRPSNGYPSARAPTEYGVFYAPSAARAIRRVVPEWAPAAALVLAMPEGEVLGNPSKEAVFAEVVRLASSRVPVAVLLDKRRLSLVPTVLSMLKAHGTEPDRLAHPLQFLPAEIDSEWIRDYAPLFAEHASDTLVLIDNMYRDLRAEARTARGGPSSAVTGYASDYGTFWRRNDDAVAVYFSEYLYQLGQGSGELVRTPLQLFGGDVAVDGAGALFTSTEVITMNGGSLNHVRDVLREYFGVDRVAFLRPLPSTIWHIDMFFKIVNSSTVLLADFDEEPPYASAALRWLHREARRRMEWNAALLRRYFPEKSIVRVPMPPILDVSFRHDSDSGGRAPLVSDAGLVESDLVRVDHNYAVVYRSYLNSALVQSEKDRTPLLLLPSYEGLSDFDGRARGIYQAVYPNAEIRLVRADALATDFGGIHCVSVAVPARGAH